MTVPTQEAMSELEATNQWWCEAEVQRVSREIAVLSPGPTTEKPEEYFERALESARAQQARSRELRTATSMARLLLSQGRRDEAEGLLGPVYRRFTEGFETLDLKEAKAVLDELAY
jgi:predicted ATPase